MTRGQLLRSGLLHLLHDNINHIIKALEDCSTIKCLQAFTQFACEVKYLQFMLRQLMEGCESIKLTFTYIKNKLHKDTMVTIDTCPVGGHNYNGKVERKM